jgi:hypothetical protein
MIEKESPRNLNPIWVISLFLTLSEVTIGAVATQLSGWIQGLLAIFAVTFPAGVAAAFFFVVWHRPYVLYAPRDYTKNASLPSFVEAMTIAQRNRNRAIEEAVRATAETLIEKHLTDLPSQQVTTNVKEAVQEAHERFERLQVFVDSSAVARRYGDPVPKSVAITAFDDTTMQEFLDELWAKLYPAFAPYTYGDQWILENVGTRKRFPSTRTSSTSHDPSLGDNRYLREVDIEPGDSLRIVLLTSDTDVHDEGIDYSKSYGSPVRGGK